MYVYCRKIAQSNEPEICLSKLKGFLSFTHLCGSVYSLTHMLLPPPCTVGREKKRKERKSEEYIKAPSPCVINVLSMLA